VQIGVDIGGTFTDIVALDRTGQLALTKVPSTPKDLLDGIAAAINAVLEQKGATTAILTTEGFEDVLELGRMKRSRRRSTRPSASGCA